MKSNILCFFVRWKETAQQSVKTRREKLENKLESTIRTMVEKTKLEVQKIRSFQEDDRKLSNDHSGDDDDDHSQESSDFCFSVRF